MNSLQKRVGIASVLSLLVFGAVILSYTLVQERASTLRAIESEIKKSAGFLVPQAYLLLKRDDSSAWLDTTQVAESIVKQGSFCYVEIADSEGRLKVPMDSREGHTRFIKNGPWGTLAMGRDFVIREDSYADSGPVIEGVFGIVEKDKILGYVILGVSTRPLYAALLRSGGTTAGILFLLLIVAAVTSWKLARKATAPVLELTESVQRYSGLEDLKKFDIRGPREVEILAERIKEAFAAATQNEESMKRAVASKTETLLKTQQELKIILDGFRKLGRSLRLEDATRIIADIARSIVYCQTAFVALSTSEDGREIVPAEGNAHFKCYPLALSQTENPPVTGEVVLKILDRGGMELVPSVKDSPYFGKVAPNVRSCAMIPLNSGEGNRFGILFLGMTGDTPFDENELSVLQSLMEPINLSLDNVFLYSQVEKLATCDSMTGLLNHQNIREKLLDAIKIARRQNSPVHVIACDIDKFKNFNDTYGHAAGDKVIKAFAKILTRSRRTGEEAGRPGGEEFLVVLSNADRQSAEAAAERILKEVRSASVPIDSGESVTFRASLGIAGIPQDAASLDELLDKADRALYVAKSRGRDRLVVWDKTIDDEYERSRT